MGNTMNYTSENRSGQCGCKQELSQSWTCKSEEFPIGMAYVPWQKWRDIYEPARALNVGTIFAELDKPFLGMRGVRK